MEFPNEIVSALNLLTLEEKVQLLSGEDAWTTYAVERIGLRKMTVSDGPTGVRGPHWDERDPSLALPSATCIASTWNRETLVRVGEISAKEARRKGVDVVLGPTINLHRTPVGGRHFECYSEDPFLTGELASAYIEGTQNLGVGTTPKHYVGNDSEKERFTYDSQIEEQTLNELYLAPFEKAVKKSAPWTIMAAYNSVNSHTMTENPLLRDPLSTQWGFDGVIMSDWTALRSVVEAGNAGLDLAMPGPTTPWSQGLLEAVENGLVSIGAIDEKVSRILLLASRVGALPATPSKSTIELPYDAREEIRNMAAEGMVLLENDGILPIVSPSHIAVIGSHAQKGRHIGGGSATVIPFAEISPLKGLTSLAPAEVTVDYAAGYQVIDELESMPIDQCQTKSGERGISLTWFNEKNEVILEEVRRATFFLSFGEPITLITKRWVAHTNFTATEDGVHRFGFGGIGKSKISVDGVEKFNEVIEPITKDVAEVLFAQPQKYFEINLAQGQTISMTFEHVPTTSYEAVAALWGYRPPRINPEIEWNNAIELAAKSDVAILVVGTTEKYESEGYDRTSLKLPGRQDELIKAVLEVNKNVVVVVNAGGPVEMPWAKEVRGLILTWFPGEEFGNALGDIIYGAKEPGGRLPTTWGSSLSEVPIQNANPIKGKIYYSEGLNIGYRQWIAEGRKPAYWFGSGFGYTTWKFNNLSIKPALHPGEDLWIEFELMNTGERRGSHVPQIYIRALHSSVKRPALWLAGFTKETLEPGKSRKLEVEIPARAFQHWSEGWLNESTDFEIVLASSAELNDALSAVVKIANS